MPEGLSMNKKHYFYLLSVILILIISASGWFATVYLGNKARQEIDGESRASVLTLSVYVTSTINAIGLHSYCSRNLPFGELLSPGYIKIPPFINVR